MYKLLYSIRKETYFVMVFVINMVAIILLIPQAFTVTSGFGGLGAAFLSILIVLFTFIVDIITLVIHNSPKSIKKEK